jgi:hypothetical protein
MGPFVNRESWLKCCDKAVGRPSPGRGLEPQPGDLVVMPVKVQRRSAGARRWRPVGMSGERQRAEKRETSRRECWSALEPWRFGPIAEAQFSLISRAFSRKTGSHFFAAR